MAEINENTIVLASDHAGFELKDKLVNFLKKKGYDVLDLGTDSTERVDYPDYGYKLAKVIAANQAKWGVAVCGSGIGISIAANREQAVRAALCVNEEMAQLARQHNNANVIAFGARLINEEMAVKCVETFLTTEFEGGRHVERVEKLCKYQ
jgi:ribose 5-phosphate isomerase B